MADDEGNQKHQISCINCRTRKVKCDKVYPCGPCQKLQVDCTFRAKKARPKKSMVSKAKSSDINSRLDRLDQLVSKLGSLQGVQLPQDVQNLLTGSTPTEQSKIGETGPGTGKTTKELSFGPRGMYPGLRSEFWMNLSDEVDGLRHTLCGDSDEESSDTSDEEGPMSPSSRSTNTASVSSTPFLFGAGAVGLRGRGHPNAAEVLRLTEAYFERVDTLFKFLHGPTVRILIGRVVAEGTKPEISKPEQALLFTMYFAAVNAMNDREYALLQQDRRSALMYYKNCAESALADADLLCTTDLITLQAFVIYLLALRSIDTSQATWSLIGLAIRLAQALDLHREIACTRIPPYQVQMRRRLYWVLGLMDVQAFQDRGLSPLLQSNTPSFPQKPANVNDTDFGPDTKEPVTSRLTMTEMTIPLISAVTVETALKLASRPSTTLQPDTRHAADAIKQLHDNLCEHMQYFDMSLPVCWFTKLVMRIAVLKIWLLAHIPVHVRLRKAEPDITRRDVMICCITIMEMHHDIHNHEPMKRFAWYHSNWHQWHPLAVCLAELIGTPTGDLADRAWMTVHDSFHQWKRTVADGKRGALWRPIKRLYEKAKRARLQAIGASYNTPNSDGSSPANELGLPQSLADLGEERHRLHDQALRKATSMGPTELSPLLFFNSSSTPESLSDLRPQLDSAAQSTPTTAMEMTGLGSMPDDTINWADWNNFLQESWETGIMGADLYDEGIMEGIMNMPFEAPETQQMMGSGQIPQEMTSLTASQQLQAAASMTPSQQLQAAAAFERTRAQQDKPWMDHKF